MTNNTDNSTAKDNPQDDTPLSSENPTILNEESPALDDLNLTTSENTTDTTDSDEPQIVYLKAKNPFLSILLKFSIGTVGFILVLFIIGFVMGMLGVNPPSMDWNVVNGQIDKITGKEKEKTPSELEKVKENDKLMESKDDFYKDENGDPFNDVSVSGNTEPQNNPSDSNAGQNDSENSSNTPKDSNGSETTVAPHDGTVDMEPKDDFYKDENGNPFNDVSVSGNTEPQNKNN